MDTSGNPQRIELKQNWKLISSKYIKTDGAAISVSNYNDERWYPIHRMPATVLEILQEDGVYPKFYVGQNMLNCSTGFIQTGLVVPYNI